MIKLIDLLKERESLLNKIEAARVMLEYFESDLTELEERIASFGDTTHPDHLNIDKAYERWRDQRLEEGE